MSDPVECPACREELDICPLCGKLKEARAIVCHACYATPEGEARCNEVHAYEAVQRRKRGAPPWL